jgi:hypothetical protein
MKYVLKDPRDGELVRWVRQEDDYVPGPGEIVLDEEPPEGWVWDAANGRPRPPTAAEVLAAAKRDAKARLEGRASTEMTNVMPVYRALLLLAKNSADPRFSTLRTLDDKITKKVGEVDAATTPEAAEAVRWEA